MKRLALMMLMVGFVQQAALAQTQLQTETLSLQFGDNGSLISAAACYPSRAASDARCVEYGDAGVVDMSGEADGWTVSPDHSNTHFNLSFEGPAGARVFWSVPLEGYLIELSLQGLEQLTLASGERFRPREAAGFGNWLEQSRYLGIDDGDVVQRGFDEEEEENEPLTVNGWAGYRNRFWALLIRAPGSADWALESFETNLDARLSMTTAQTGSQDFKLYLGPVEPRVLAEANSELSDILYAGIWFWLRYICFALFYLLSWIAQVIPSWGLAVMVMSVVVHVLMLPLSRLADRFQQQVHATEARLAPELHRIKKEFKGEQQSIKILALYKTERVHPLYSLKSLLGVAVVIPIFIGAFDMLAENIHLLNASFLWMHDLSHPDALFHLPFSIPFFGSEFNLLPFLMTGLSVAASAMHSPPAQHPDLRKKQLRNMLLMAIGFFALFYTFPAGMVLYWTTNNLISVIKSLWARR